MSQHYHLNIYQNGKLLGHFQTNTLHAFQNINLLVSYLKLQQGLTFELFQIIEDERYLIQKDGVMKILGAKLKYVPCALEISKLLHQN